MKGCTEEKKPSWRNDELACWPDASSTQPSLLPSFTLPCLHCFTLNLTNVSLLTHVGWKLLGLPLEWKPMILGLLEKDVKLFKGQVLESCKEGIRCRVPLCLLYLTAEQRRSAGSHRTAHEMFVVATVCTQGRRMLWPFDCVAVLSSPSLLHFEITRFFWK